MYNYIKGFIFIIPFKNEKKEYYLIISRKILFENFLFLIFIILILISISLLAKRSLMISIFPFSIAIDNG